MRLIICPYDYTGHQGVSHTGLHISSLNTAKVLKAAGLDVLMFPVVGAIRPAPMKPNPKPAPAGTYITDLIARFNPTHIVTCAFWVPVAQVQQLVTQYPYIVFAINCHSNIAFLQAEPGGLTMARALVDLEQQTTGNFHLSGNSRSFVESVEHSWEAPCSYLPNLYYLDEPVVTDRPKYTGGTLRIGAFGALRPLKNPTVSAFAALAVASAKGAKLEFYVNVGRNDGWGTRTLEAVRAIMANLPNATLIEVPWQNWSAHRRLVRTMHLLLQPSFTESFNLVTADGAAEGIPSVVGDVIEWAPIHWRADPDNSNDVARVGLNLLADPRTGKEGKAALQRNNVLGVAAWKEYLNT